MSESSRPSRGLHGDFAVFRLCTVSAKAQRLSAGVIERPRQLAELHVPSAPSARMACTVARAWPRAVQQRAIAEGVLATVLPTGSLRLALRSPLGSAARRRLRSGCSAPLGTSVAGSFIVSQHSTRTNHVTKSACAPSASRGRGRLFIYRPGDRNAAPLWRLVGSGRKGSRCRTMQDKPTSNLEPTQRRMSLGRRRSGTVGSSHE